ncbi:MAG: response regulator transcription factor [Verrucomicrobia bacterium]|nr:response regulator transcription factor [Verrucomicrobiota bacterium]
MKFVLVEDQVMFRGLIRQMLMEECRGKILLETTTLAELRAGLDQVRAADLLLLDVRLPDGDGLDFVDEMTAAHIATPVLLFSSSCEDYVVHRVSRTFAQGFVHKDEEPKVLLTAIQTVAAGGAFFSPHFVERRRRLEKNPVSFDKLLSPREQELLRYIGAGCTDAEAAAAIGASTGTVQAHRRNIMHKLSVHNAKDLQAYALRAGFTTVTRLQ